MFKSHLLAKTLLVCSGIYLCSCASLEQNPESEPAPVQQTGLENTNGEISLDLFAARGFLGGSDYERLVLNGNSKQGYMLWKECGNVSSGKSKSSATEAAAAGSNQDPQLKLIERKVEKLSAEQFENISIQATRLAQLYAEQKKEAAEGGGTKLPAPGSVFSLASAGVMELSLKLGNSKTHIITSVDAVSDKQTPLLALSHELFSKLRNTGAKVCGPGTFYGIK